MMRKGEVARRAAVSNNWWRDFFEPIVGEVLFATKTAQAEAEVRQIVRRARAEPPAKVLDLACGTGRHSRVFAARGFEVTGLDYSPAFLRDARLAVRAAGQHVRFVRGDMKRLNSYFAANEFDLVVSLFHSFGYFPTRRDDLKVLQAVHDVLKPGGAFVLNTLNGTTLAERLRRPISFGYEPLPNLFVIDAPQYDAAKKRMSETWTIIDARAKTARISRRSFRQNIYSHAELRRLLSAAGFTVETAWGRLAGGAFKRRESWEQTILARRRRK